jgi:hypothetical protein
MPARWSAEVATGHPNGVLIEGQQLRITPHYLQLYQDQYARLDATGTPLFFSEVGRVATTKDLVPYDEFLRTRFYLQIRNLGK